MRKSIHFLAMGVLWVAAQAAFAQQQAIFSQYMFNIMSINPAYTGSHEALSFTALSRWQWEGVDGAPNTQTFTMHSPLRNKQAALGLYVINDNIGVANNTSVNVSAAYRIPSKRGYFSMGLQGGFSNYTASFSTLNPQNPDPNLAENRTSDFLPNLGIGLFYYAEKWYAGLSMPQMFAVSVEEGGDEAVRQIQHTFLIAGYVFDLSPRWKVRPNVLFKGVEGAPLQLDLNANLILDDKYWVGASWRSFDSFQILLEWQALDNLRVGYAYDITTTAINTVSSGSHEIAVNYRVKLRRDQIITPRYF